MFSAKEKNLNWLERQAYLKAHKNEDPFPLDGSNWARLIREKQYLEHHPHVKCEGKENLLLRLHSKNSLLERERRVLPKAIHHWFLHETQPLANQFWTDQLSAQELARYKIYVDKKLSASGGDISSELKRAEDNWLADRLIAGANQNVYIDEFWLSDCKKRRETVEADKLIQDALSKAETVEPHTPAIISESESHELTELEDWQI